MEKQYPDPIFPDGMMAFMPNEKLPEYYLIDIHIKPHQLFSWCQDQMKFADKNGFIKFNIKKSKKGTIYAELNQYIAPVESAEAKEYNQTKYQPDMATTSTQKDAEQIFGKPLTEEEMPSLEDIPF